MSNNAQLMSTAPSCFVRDMCPPSVSGKSSGQKQNTTAFVMAVGVLVWLPVVVGGGDGGAQPSWLLLVQLLCFLS